MGGIHIFEKPCYREIRAMRGRVMRGLPVQLWVLLQQYFFLKDVAVGFICKSHVYFQSIVSVFEMHSDV